MLRHTDQACAANKLGLYCEQGMLVRRTSMPCFGEHECMKAAYPSAMRGMTAYILSRILPQQGERAHTSKGNVYRVVTIK